jgi:hypothetical protein
MTEWDEREETDADEEEGDPGLIGGGGPGATMDETDVQEEELEEHGDRLTRPDE